MRAKFAATPPKQGARNPRVSVHRAFVRGESLAPRIGNCTTIFVMEKPVNEPTQPIRPWLDQKALAGRRQNPRNLRQRLSRPRKMVEHVDRHDVLECSIRKGKSMNVARDVNPIMCGQIDV